MSQEYVNAAFEIGPTEAVVEAPLCGDDANENNDVTAAAAAAANLISQQLPGDVVPLTARSAPVTRCSSFADVTVAAMTSESVASSLRSLASSTSVDMATMANEWRHDRRRQKYRHPFGRSENVLGEILCGESEAATGITGSMAKVIVWVVFGCFVLAVVGAIILGAGKFATITPNISIHASVIRVEVIETETFCYTGAQ